MTVTDFDDKEQLELGIEFQRIRARIKNTLTLPVDNLGKSTGAPTDPTRYVRSRGEPKDDLIYIFRRMLDVGTPEYEHGLAEFLHNGPPNMDHVRIECGGKIYGKGDPVREAQEAEYFEERRKEKERRIRIAAKIKTLVVTKKEDLDILSSPNQNQKFDFQCYIPDCNFVTNCKSTYERHVVTKHPGKLCYPGKVDLKLRGWTAQGRKWEV